MKKGLGLKSVLMLSLMFGAGAVCAGATPASGPIATIAQSEGMVLVNQGKYYVVARPGQQLNVGDRIMTMAGASASIAYKDGCVQQLKPNNKLVFNSVAECSTKTAKIQSVGPYYAALGDPALVGAAVAGAETIFGVATTTVMGVGGAVIAGGVIVSITEDDPVSSM
jgi:hypothetical protein